MFQPQQQIGPYTLVRLLGRGGFGEVWLADKPGELLTPQVALKLPLDPDPNLDAIKREARVWLQASGHPNVLPVQDALIFNGQVVIISEYAAGGSLAAWLKKHGGKAPSVAAAIAMTSHILAGLAYLHTLQPEPIIHRDLKPDNVLLQGGLPRLTDFGISRVLKTSDHTQYASGTPHYMPPEAFKGHYSPQSDVWAAGVMLYQMLSGRLPFPQADLPGLYGAILNDAPAPLPDDIPEAIRKVVASALEKDPMHRLPSADAMRALLNLPAVPSESKVVIRPPDNKSTDADLPTEPQLDLPVNKSHVPLDKTDDLPSLDPKKRPDVSRRTAVIGGVVCGIGIASYVSWHWLSKRPTLLSTLDLTLKGHGSNVNSVAISADGKRIVTGSGDDTAKVWDATTGNELLTLRGHIYSVNSVAITEDSKYILTGSGDKTAKLWDAETGKEIFTIRGHELAVDSVAISSTGKRIVTSSEDKTAKVWDMATGNELLTLKGHTSSVTSIAISWDGKHIVTGSSDSFSTSSSDHTAKFWDAAIGKELRTLTGPSSIASVALSEDCKRIVTGSSDAKATVWDAETGQILLTLGGHTESVLAVALSRNGQRIVTGSRDHTAKIWDAATGKELLTLTGHKSDIFSVAISEDGKRIVTGSADETAKVWSLT